MRDKKQQIQEEEQKARQDQEVKIEDLEARSEDTANVTGGAASDPDEGGERR